MKKIIKILFFLIVVALIAGLCAWVWYYDSVSPSNSVEEVNFVVSEGETTINVLQRLEESGVIKSSIAARIYIQLENLTPEIRFGNYTLKKNNDIKEILNQLSVGAFAQGIQITIKEGLRDDQLADMLSLELNNEFFNKNEFMNIIQKPGELIGLNQKIDIFLSQIELDQFGISGMLFPDTYIFALDATAKDVASKMFENFISKTAEFNQRPDFREKLILSSIIEREASANDDYNKIASVFKNRLRDGMLLQSDATVNFITKKNDTGVTFADAAIDSPFNTYKYAGLPPAPICNPGLRSIQAAYSDETSIFYYFFHFENQTYFSLTYNEHVTQLKNVGLL